MQGARRSKKSTFRIQYFALRVLCGYFAVAQYDKVYQYNTTSQYDKFGLLSKNNGQRKRTLSFGRDGYFYSNFKAKIQIFHSKFKAFYKFKSFDKFNSFYNFISNFKPYTRLFHIFTPNFRSVQADKFQHKEKKWQMKTPSLIILSI